LNGLNKTIFVTFPRSGHHLLIRGLHVALPQELVYSEFYQCEHNMDNCFAVNAQKDHDFKLERDIEGYRYIVQVRDVTDCLYSWYIALNSKESFREFYEVNEKYYHRFMNKWILSEIDNRLIIKYEDLVKEKKETVLKVANFMSKGEIDFSKRFAHLEAWEIGENNYLNLKI